MLEYLEFNNQNLETLETKNCIKCGFERPINISFFKQQRNQKLFNNHCKICLSNEAKEDRIKNPDLYKKLRREYYLSVKDSEEFKKKQEDYKKRYNELSRKRYKNKRIKENKFVKERDITEIKSEFVFRSVGPYIKDKVNCRYLPYKTEELIKHLENQFEWWMTWDNWGVYRARKWNDNDPSTWVWNIDHIIPYSDLPYTSPDDENFKKCWSLDNLRPYSGKHNIKDGASRKRHNPTNKRIRVVKINEEKIRKENELIKNVQKLFYLGLRSKNISLKLGISKKRVLKIYKKLNISKEEAIQINKKSLPETKICKVCKLNIKINEFRIRKNKSGNLQAEARCKECECLVRKCERYILYYNIKEYEDHLKNLNYDKLLELKQNYKKYAKRNSSESFLALDFRIRSFLKRNIMKDISYKYLNYSMSDLRKHLENQFNDSINWGNLDKTWSIGHMQKFSTIKEYYRLENMIVKIK
jgi:hypothetical protein